MAISQELLKKFLKLTKLRVTSVEEDGTPETRVLKLTLEAPVSVIGSNIVDGQKMVHKEDIVYVAADDCERFLETAEGDEDGITYEGSMKLDVSKPNGRFENGKFVMTKPPKLWLTSVAFNKRGAGLVQDRQTALRQATKDMFAGIIAAGEAVNDITSKLEVVDED